MVFGECGVRSSNLDLYLRMTIGQFGILYEPKRDNVSGISRIFNFFKMERRSSVVIFNRPSRNLERRWQSKFNLSKSNFILSKQFTVLCACEMEKLLNVKEMNLAKMDGKQSSQLLLLRSLCFVVRVDQL